ncbi:MAG: DNA translocase FtsK [Clostridia bacterium]|nr:DNA translocase FtsK [Clostridia bacterium]MCI9086258.1 DNA translocase FtsK [Clostridia bacterium]
MVKMVQTIASYIILSLTLIIFASLITGVSIFRELAKWIRSTFLDAKERYYEFMDEREQQLDEQYEQEEIYFNEPINEGNILDAANSFDAEIEGETKSKNKKVAKAPKKETANNVDDFSNGIDAIFGKMPEEPEQSEPVNEAQETKNIETPEKVEKISDKEKQDFNDEFNKAIEQPAVEYVYPKITLLNKPKPASGDKRDEMRRTAEKLISVLDNFGVKAKLLQVTQGPTVTRYEIQPDTGIKLSKIVGLADDIALNLAVSTVLVAPVPGKAAVGIEIPNNKVSAVSIREILESDAFKKAKSKLTVALGKDIGGNVVVGDIAKMPHVLIAGATGSGKSVCINTIITSILYKASPDEVKLIMVDPKVVELGVYNGIPHLLVPVVTDPKKAAGALNWAVTEMMRRYELFKDTGVRKLESYNKLMESEGGEKIPNLVIIVDELADLMMVAAKEVEDYIVRLTQLARAAGIHLIIATQRPSVDVITGLIKANVPSRIAFAVSSQVDSRTILDKGGAEKLLGMGDMLYYPMGARATTRVQGAFVSDQEIEKILDFIKENVGETHYSEDLAEEIERHSTGENGVTPDTDDDGDELLPEAIELALSQGKISTSSIQRRLSVGYSRAGRIIDQMEARGIISGANGSKPRDVLLTRADLEPPVINDEDEQYE